MKTLFAALLLAFAGSASAASVAMKPPVGITGNPASATGWTTASNFVGNFSAASFSGGFTTNVGGKAVTMPATMRMAANAGRFAVSAVRLTPSALIGSAVATWLLSQGLEWIDGQFMKRPTGDPIVGGGWVMNGYQGKVLPMESPLDSCVAAYTGSQFGFIRCEPLAGNQFRIYLSDRTIYNTAVQVTDCPSGYNWNASSSSCVPVAKPATATDFAPLEAAPLPDSVADELAPKGVALPMENPVFDPAYVDEPLGEPYVDPVTGKRYQDKVRVTPQSDGKTADVQTHKQEVDEEGDPATDPTTGVEAPPEKQDDFCKQNPEASSCKPFDEPPDLDLEKKENPFSLNPVSGFGADSASCPAPQSLFTAGGQQVVWDWGNFCKFAQGIRPLIIGFAWLTAIMIVVSVGRRNG